MNNELEDCSSNNCLSDMDDQVNELESIEFNADSPIMLSQGQYTCKIAPVSTGPSLSIESSSLICLNPSTFSCTKTVEELTPEFLQLSTEPAVVGLEDLYKSPEVLIISASLSGLILVLLVTILIMSCVCSAKLKRLKSRPSNEASVQTEPTEQHQETENSKLTEGFPNFPQIIVQRITLSD